MSSPPRGEPRPSGSLRGRDAAGQAPHLRVDEILDDRQVRIVVCCGSGGVGKTTTAAALAVRAAGRGRRTVVLTIDPARRLAQSMGLTELDNTPRAVPGIELGSEGSLDAMMLDMKRTFDDIVVTHATPDKAAQILGNPFYQAVSSSFAGTQEYMAMEKLGQLRAENRWDLIVVDTPPSRSALDFLDAPARLGSFLDGRLIRILSAPARAGGKAYLKVLTAGIGAFTGILTKVLGGELLINVQTFVAALDTMFGGFRERADATFALLQASETRFLVVATPEHDALREAAYFVERLEADRMPLAGLVLNRVHPVAQPAAGNPGGPTAASVRSQGRARAHPGAAGEIGVERAEEAAAQLRSGQCDVDDDAANLTAALLELHARRSELAHREQHIRARFHAAHPDVPIVDVPALPGDVHDLDGLLVVGECLADAPRTPASR